MVKYDFTNKKHQGKFQKKDKEDSIAIESLLSLLQTLRLYKGEQV